MPLEAPSFNICFLHFKLKVKWLLSVDENVYNLVLCSVFGALQHKQASFFVCLFVFLKDLTVACQKVLKTLVKAQRGVQVDHGYAEVVKGDNDVLWIPHHVDDLTKKNKQTQSLKPRHTY